MLAPHGNTSTTNTPYTAMKDSARKQLQFNLARHNLKEAIDLTMIARTLQILQHDQQKIKFAVFSTQIILLEDYEMKRVHRTNTKKSWMNCTR